MIQAIDFLPRRVFETLPPQADLAVVSIGDPDQRTPEILSAYPYHVRLAVLDREDHAYRPVMQCATRQLIEFVQQLHALPKVWRLIVHCEAGVSRSAAAALVAERLTGAWFPRRPDSNFANQLLLLEAGALLRKPIGRPDAEPVELLPCWLAI